MKASIGAAILLIGCGTTSAPAAAPTSAPTSRPSVAGAPTTSAAASPTVSKPREPPTATLDEVWTRVRADITTCYETGRRAIPTMVDGRITLEASIAADGKTACVVPSDDTGLTQEVADCMRERLEREAYPASRAGWSLAVPIAVKSGAVSLAPGWLSLSIDTVESRGLTEEMYDVLDGLLPDVKECVRGIGVRTERRVVVVGARVGKDGMVACAVASSTSAIPEEARRCVADVFARGRFRPPKRGIGLLSVPIEIR